MSVCPPLKGKTTFKKHSIMKHGSRPEEIAAIQAAVQTARAALNDVATIDDSERTTAAAGLARAQAELRRAQTEYDKIAWAGEVGTTPQALALEQATIDYENSLADYNLDTNPSDSQLAPLQAQLAQAQLQLGPGQTHSGRWGRLGPDPVAECGRKAGRFT